MAMIMGSHVRQHGGAVKGRTPETGGIVTGNGNSATRTATSVCVKMLLAQACDRFYGWELPENSIQGSAQKARAGGKR